MFGNWCERNLIWLLIFLKVFLTGTGAQSTRNNPSPEGPSLVNASLARGIKGQNLNIEHGANAMLNNMVAMVASLRGNYDTSVAGDKFGVEDEEYRVGAEKLPLVYDWHLKLDPLNRFRLDWSVDYARNGIIFALNINHTSSKFHQGSDVFALGFSADGQLPSSDFCIIWYDLSHNLHLQDARTDAKSRLQLIDSGESYCKLVKSHTYEHPRARGEDRFDNSDLEENSAEEIPQKGRAAIEDGGGGQNIQVVFKRPLEVCAPARNNYYKIDNGTTHLVWFTIRGPLLSMDGLDLVQLQCTSGCSTSARAGQHQRMVDNDGELDGKLGQFEWGMSRVQLISQSKPTKAPATSAKSLSLEIRMDKFEIPAQETTYWCKLFKLPHKFETRKYHLTEYEAVIEKGNGHVVHHMELFNCANLNGQEEQALHDLYNGPNGGWSGDCGGSDRPRATQPCRKVILAWAMGAHPLVYPEMVGQSVGGHGYSPYVVLEVHYNNVESTKGLVDNSGLRFRYTSKLRPYEAGVLEVGLEYTDKMSIPPGLVAPIAGHCVGECTRLAMSAASATSGAASTGNNRQLEDGIYIFAGQMHTHLAGVASWTEIVREGRLVGELQRDNHYSPHFQEIRLLPEHVHVAPGDHLVHYCLYDTRSRPNITLGGYATSDEMCVTYLHYYPRIDLEVCKSSVETGALEAYFAYLAREENQNTSERLVERNTEAASDGRAAKTVGQNYHSIEWNPRRSRELLQFYAHAPLSVQCNRSNGDRWPGYWNGITPTRLWSDLKAEVGPFETRLPKGDQLMAYRGRGFASRHAQCQV